MWYNKLQSLCSVVYTYANDICMSFGLDKCKCVPVLRGNLKDSDNIKLPSDEVIHQLVPGGDYHYLGILESISFKTNQMKDKLQAECKRNMDSTLEKSGAMLMTSISGLGCPIVALLLKQRGL